VSALITYIVKFISETHISMTPLFFLTSGVLAANGGAVALCCK
jgi:surface polysaccharide O-acyltransferase-like enzyme